MTSVALPKTCKEGRKKMTHVRTADGSQSICTESNEFDVYVSGETVVVGPQPNDYCEACRAGEPEWEIVSDEEFRKRWPL